MDSLLVVIVVGLFIAILIWFVKIFFNLPGTILLERLIQDWKIGHEDLGPTGPYIPQTLLLRAPFRFLLRLLTSINWNNILENIIAGLLLSLILWSIGLLPAPLFPSSTQPVPAKQNAVTKTPETKHAPIPNPPKLVIHLEDEPFPVFTEKPNKPGVFFFIREFEVANTSEAPAIESTITTRTYTTPQWLSRVPGDKYTILKGNPIRRKIRVELSANPVKELCIDKLPVLTEIVLHWEDEDGNNYDDTEYIQYFCERHFAGPDAPHYFRWAKIGKDLPQGVPKPTP